MGINRNWTAFLTLFAALSTTSVLMAQTTHVVEVGDNFFSPSELTIETGDTVRWENAAGGGIHDVVSETNAWTPSVLANEFTFEVTFNDSETFDYFCTPHRNFGMVGTINVEEAAAEVNINAGMNDAWVSADAPFQGFFFTVFPDLGFLFLSWFTFDSVAPDASVTASFGAPDQRWVTGLGAYTGNTVTLNVELTSGGIFNAAEPLATQDTGYGTITIVFISCNEAILTYDFPSVGLSGEMTLTRVVDDNVALCEALATP